MEGSARMKAGIIIPFRDSFKNYERYEELFKLLPILSKVFRGNTDSYEVLVIKQQEEYLFNRAMLLNIGIRLARESDYFILQDVDHYPVNTENLYRLREYSGCLIRKENESVYNRAVKQLSKLGEDNMKTHIIDGEEYEECKILNNWDLEICAPNDKIIYLRKVKRKIEFPVRVELRGGYCLIDEDGDISGFGERKDKCSIFYRSDLQKINEKMKELEEQGAFE